MSARSQLRFPFQPRDGAVRPAAGSACPGLQRASCGLPSPTPRPRFPVRFPPLKGRGTPPHPHPSSGKNARRNLAEVNQQQVSYPSATHLSPISYHQFRGAADQPQGWRPGNSGQRPWPGRRCERSRVLTALGLKLQEPGFENL